LDPLTLQVASDNGVGQQIFLWECVRLYLVLITFLVAQEAVPYSDPFGNAGSSESGVLQWHREGSGGER
jgi:hypothetical protein